MSGHEVASIDTYAATFLKQNDRDRYFSTLLLPNQVRVDITALFAFAADIAAVPDRVTTPEAGEIRLQWWSETLQGAGRGDVPQNPLAAAVQSAISARHWSLDALLALIEARRFDLYNDPMPDWPTFEGYAGETNATLLQMSALALGAEPGGNLADAAGHAGVAQALVGHMRAFAHNAARQRLFLPLEVFAAHHVKPADIFARQETPHLTDALSDIQVRARDHQKKAKTAIARLPRAHRPAFAIIALNSVFLKKLRFDKPLFEPRPELADWQKIVRMALWAWTQKN